ncbi:MAG: guanylate cyclase [Gammaproteobacteria bacterium]|nr:MAG: guanylate cyclase [Gammaproteobacteria bacterium]
MVGSVRSSILLIAYTSGMKCVTCKHDNEADALFCEECGCKLALSCVSCGAELKPTAKFCLKCGTAVVAASPVKFPTRNVAAYTPKHLADKILQSKSALEGERKQVTVLFADVKGSMELAGQLDSEQWHIILDKFFQILSDGVHRFEGTVNQYTGDGIMALFGAPIAHEDHAQRACYAALHLQEEIAHYGTKIQSEYGVSFATRMGLNSGEVIVGSIGDDLRMDYTAQGHMVGLAQRMESLAEQNQCYLAPATAELVSGYFILDDIGEFPVKGIAAPVRVHRLSSSVESHTRLDTARARGLSSLVGRATDLHSLEDALGQAETGNGQVIGVVAEAGAGKSRLCYEFLEQCRASGLQVFEARAVAHGRNLPLLPILELFRSYFSITIGDNDLRAREKIVTGLNRLDQHYAEALPLLSDFLGVADPQQAELTLDPDERQRQLVELMCQLINGIGAGVPTVTLIEDLHWIDSASAEFLERLVDASANSRSLLLLNFRPEYHAQWMQKSWYRQIPLMALGAEDISDMLSEQLGHDPSLASLADLVHGQTGGNPFFAEEIAQSLIESGRLKGTWGAYRLTTPVEHLVVPATVQAVLAARIDRLPEREKRLLQVASVIGKDFTESLLGEVAELSRDELKAALTGLRHAEFIYQRGFYRVTDYSFKHPLTQEVALVSQLHGRRRQLHAAVAATIEQQNPKHSDEHAALLAHHWDEADEALYAARWHRRAAEWVGLTDFASSTHHWRRVHLLARELPEDNEIATLGIAACTRLLGLSLSTTAGLDEARSLLEEGQTLANTMGDSRAHLSLSQAYSFALNSAGDMVAYLELTIENQGAALEIDDIGVQANASLFLVDALGHAGRLPEVLEVADDGLAKFPRDIPPEEWISGINPYSMFLIWRGYCLCIMGQMPEGLEELGHCLRLSKEDGTSEMAGYALLLAAEAHCRANDAEQALACAHQLKAISGSMDEPANLVALTQLAFGYAHLAAGHPVDAIAPARDALHLHGHVENEMTGWSATLLAEALLATGDLTAAAAAEEAIKLCRRSQRKVYEAVAQGILARALLRQNETAACEAALAAASELIERTGARSLGIALLEWRAELAASLGDEAVSEQLLYQAEQGYAEIGAPKQAQRLAAKRKRHLA